MVKNLLAMREMWAWSLSQEDPLEKGMATHSNILAWRIQWTAEPGGLQSMESQRVGLDWVTNTFHLPCTCFYTHLTLVDTSLAARVQYLYTACFTFCFTSFTYAQNCLSLLFISPLLSMKLFYMFYYKQFFKSLLHSFGITQTSQMTFVYL